MPGLLLDSINLQTKETESNLYELTTSLYIYPLCLPISFKKEGATKTALNGKTKVMANVNSCKSSDQGL
jgi:hypothetical protein